MTDYERKRLKMQNDPEYAKMYRERDALYKRNKRKQNRLLGIKPKSRYIPSISGSLRPLDSVTEETIRAGYLKYLKSIGKFPEGNLQRKSIY